VTEPFAQHRRLLFAVAYDLLGSVADAEDVVQETWLRWSKTDHADVRDPRAYLVRTATTQALNRIRANQARRETYIGPWLPEPLVEPESDPAVAVTERAAREHAVSLAMLVVLESLTPDERAVFVLREVFGMPHDDIANALGRTSAAVRQLAHRAREHVQARRPRFEADSAEQRRVTEEFLGACASGDMTALLGLLAPDVTLVSDGGGLAQSARRPILGPDKVARFMLGITPDALAYELDFALVNGVLGIVVYGDGTARTVAQLDIVDGQVQTVYIVANPEKLQHVSR